MFNQVGARYNAGENIESALFELMAEYDADEIDHESEDI